MVDSKKLRGKIAEAGMTKTKFAHCIGMTYNSLSSKMNGNSQFKVSEAAEIASLLNLSNEEIVSIFLPDKTQ